MVIYKNYITSVAASRWHMSKGYGITYCVILHTSLSLSIVPNILFKYVKEKVTKQSTAIQKDYMANKLTTKYTSTLISINKG